MTTQLFQPVRLLLPAERVRLHEASVQLLATTGLLVRNSRAREILKSHGCMVDLESGRVQIPPATVERLLPGFGRSYTFVARDPAFDLSLPSQGPCFVTASSATKVIDRVSGKQRDALSSDIADIARLINELPGYDMFSVSTLAADAPAGQFSLSRLYPALKYCQKPLRTNTMSIPDLVSVLDCAYTVAGGRQAYFERPFVNHHYCPVVSPLTFDVESTEACTYLLELGLPVYTTVVPNAGMTSPLNLVGTLVVANAEFLAINCYFQMVREGSPALYAYLPTVADMRTGNYTPGNVECALLEVGLSEMADYYGVPSGGYIGQTDSHAVDMQAGQETALGATATVLAGASLINLGGLLDSLVTFDFAKAVLDSDLAMSLKRLARGLEFSEEGIARSLEELDEVGPGGDFMCEEQTLENMATLCYHSDLASKDIRAHWEAAGAKTAEERARAKAEGILQKPAHSYLSQEVDRLLRDQFPGLVDV